MADTAEDILYSLSVFIIQEYLVENNCYIALKKVAAGAASPTYKLYTIGGISPYNSYDPEELKKRGYSNNHHNIPQVTHIYEPQSLVLACHPRLSHHNPVKLNIGFILGEVSCDLLSEFPEKPVHKNCESIHSSDLSEFSTFLNNVSQEQKQCKQYYKGNLQNDTLPGDYVIKGEHTKFCLDNYTTIIGTDTVNSTYSEITGELVERARIKNTQDILSQSRTFLVDNKALTLNKYSFDPDYSFFNCYTVEEGKLVKDITKEPRYAVVKAMGNSIEGAYTTLYQQTDGDDPKDYPVFQEHLSPDGTYQVLTAKSLRIGKGVDFAHIECSGNTFQDKEHSELVKIDAPRVEYRNAKVPVEASFADSIEYPKISTDDMYQELPMALLSHIDFENDGSIKIRDAWGSYLYFHRGNIQIHAANNIFQVAGRDTIFTSGGVESHRVAQDIHMQSINKDIALCAGGDIDLKAQTFNTEANDCNFTIKNEILLSSQFTAINSARGAVALGNAKNTVKLTARDTLISASNSITIIAEPCAILMDRSGSFTFCGNSKFTGNICLVDEPHEIKLNDDAKPIKLYNGHGSIFITTGGLYANSNIGSNANIMASCIMAKDIASSSGFMGTVENFNVTLQSIKTMITKRKGTSLVEKTYQIADTGVLQDFVFKFKSISKSCTYVSELCELGASGNITVNSDYFSYPGAQFWQNNGIVYYGADGEHYLGFQYYNFNNHNISE